MKSLPPTPKLSLALLLTSTITIIATIPTTHAKNTQIEYNDQRTEYCYHESFNLGTCLGKAQQSSHDSSNAHIIQCMECSGRFQGDETCNELKALNNVGISHNASDRFSIDWQEPFCETYDRCVERHCPKECWKEQDAWLECSILELNCDWRCPGSTWRGNRIRASSSSSSSVVVGLRCSRGGWYCYFSRGMMLVGGGTFVGWAL
mmetsp:Transcript_13233/g.20004  ORF Transcript_13233/g.20004 Transcript_13233/m.20004 type:complete len:205 (-) Transcript_13233:342-956(-)